MNRSAICPADFAGEERTFRLSIGPLRALQEKTDCGPMELLQRFAAGTWRVDDLRETILQGLVGGGMPSPEASRLIRFNFDDLPLQPFVILAQGIVMAALVGAEDEDLGEPEGEELKSPSPEAKSGSARSTASPPPSVSIRAKSTP